MQHNLNNVKFPLTRIEVSPQGVAIITVLSANYSTTTLLKMDEVKAIIQQLALLEIEQQKTIKAVADIANERRVN